MRFPVNMASPLDVCPQCKDLVYVTEGAWLDVLLDGAYHASTEHPHRHQPAAPGVAPQATARPEGETR